MNDTPLITNWLEALAKPMPEYTAELVASTQAELNEGMPWLMGQQANYLVLRLRPKHRLDLGEYPAHVDWIIVEGGSEPVHPAWVRAIRDACALFDCAFLFEGWGEWEPYLALGQQIWQRMDGTYERLVLDWLDVKTWQEWEDGIGMALIWDEPGVMYRKVGKASRLLDRREHRDVPEGYISKEER
ncbi:MAG: DUF5131 family protein [Anaerolineae bacterium]|nr:DUF5131 family protein [Anaerolineae bacterium]